MNDKGKKRKPRSRVIGGGASFSHNKPKKSSSRSHQGSTNPQSHQEPSHDKMTRRPRNFSWVIDGLLAASGFPEVAGHFNYLRDQGVSSIITLSEYKPPMEYAPPGMSNVCIPVVEFEAPNIEQIESCISAIEECHKAKKACVVHCFWGLGRTGTMLACYFVKHEGMDAMSAIRQVRYTRPYSIETYEQEDAVFEYATYLNAKKSKDAEQGSSSMANDSGLADPSVHGPSTSTT